MTTTEAEEGAPAPRKQMKAPVGWSEQSVFEALRTHFVEGAVAMLPQVSSSTGAGPARRADAIVMQLWPSRGLTIEGVEIKTDRRDLLRELESPEKADLIATYCDKWWVAAPAGVVKEGDLPKMWGCLEVSVHEPGVLELDDDNRYSIWVKPHVYKVKVRKKAEENPDVKEPNRGFLASLMRNLQAHESPEAVVERRLSAMKHKAENAAWEAAQKEIEKARKSVEEIRRRVYQFEQITGIPTGAFDNVWSEEDLRAKHEKQKRLLQMAYSLDDYFEKATSLAAWLDNRGVEMKTLSDGLKYLMEFRKKDDGS